MRMLSLLKRFSSTGRLLRRGEEILRSDQGLRQALASVLAAAAECLDADSGSLLTMSRGKREFFLAAGYGPQESGPQRPAFPEGPKGPHWVYQSGESVIVGGAPSSVLVPAYLDLRCVGVLRLSRLENPRAFSEKDMRALREVARLLAGPLERLSLQERLDRTFDQMKVLADAGAAMSAARSLPALPAIARDAVARLLDAPCACALLLDPPQQGAPTLAGGSPPSRASLGLQEARGLAGGSPPSRASLGLQEARGLAAGLGAAALGELETLASRPARQALSAGQSVFLQALDCAGDLACWAGRHGFGSGLAVPLRAPGGTAGGLEFYFKDALEPSLEELSLIDSLARTCALAISNLDLTVSLNARREGDAQQERLATLGQLTATIAHEINNPLSGILGYTQLLKIGLREHAAFLEDLEKIERETGRLRSLAGSIMTCARPAQRRPSPLEDILEMSLELLRCDIKKRAARVERDYAPLPPLVCDPGRLEQAFLNVILNALQAVEDRPERRVAVRTFLDSEGALAVEIRDTGCGIAPEHLSRVFEPHFTTKQAAGSGLGLSVVRGAVEEHGGRIAIESAEQAGTTVRMTFPAQRTP